MNCLRALERFLHNQRISSGVNNIIEQYLHYIRASKALSRLLYSDKSITDIAFEVGYQDSNYFSTKFKQVFSVTPRDARLGKERAGIR